MKLCLNLINSFILSKIEANFNLSKMKVQSLLSNTLSVVFLGILMACGGNKEETSNESAEFDAAKEELIQKIEEVTYKIPSPTEVPFLIEATGADYNSELMNPKESADTYLTTFSKTAVNLGIYASDVAYLSSYGKTQESIDYMQTIKKLADHLGVLTALDAIALKRFEDNVNSKDSIEVLINQMVNKVDKYLKNEKRNKVAALVTAGSFIEGLYLSTALVNTYPKDLLTNEQRNLILTPVIKVILDQKSGVAETIKLLESVEQNEEVTQLISDFNSLLQAYEKLNIEEQIKNNHADLMLSDETLKNITEQVGKIRARLIA